MARNRKSDSAAIRFGPSLKAFLLCLFIGGSGVGYVWQKDQIGQLGQQIAKREARLRNLREQNERLRRQLQIMCLPRSLMSRAQELGLGPPQPSQIWRLTEPAADLSVPVRELQAQYVAKRSAGSGAP